MKRRLHINWTLDRYEWSISVHHTHNRRWDNTTKELGPIVSRYSSSQKGDQNIDCISTKGTQNHLSERRLASGLLSQGRRCSYSRLHLLVAAQRLPWNSPSILFHIISSLEFFPPPCCHHTGVINQLAKTRCLNVSARYRLITLNRSNLTMNIWMHHIWERKHALK